MKKITNIYSFILIPVTILYYKIIKFNNIKFIKSYRKRWNRHLFEYFRNDPEMIEKIEGKKCLFYKKNKQNHKNKKICGTVNNSNVNINTDFPKLKECCDNKKKFIYLVDPIYTPTTIFVNSYSDTYKNIYFQKYILNHKNEMIDIDTHEIEVEKKMIDIDTHEIEVEKKMIDIDTQIVDLKYPIFKNDVQEQLKEITIISNKPINIEGRFIKKPLIGSQGNGIEIIDNFYNCFINQGELSISEDYIFQEEIKPKLFEGYKFDIRYYVILVVKQDLIEIHHVPNAMVRLCSKKFSFLENDLLSNLTNTSINKDDSFTMSISKKNVYWEKYFNEMEIITNNFFENVLTEEEINNLYEINGNSLASTRIFGFDFIISNEDKVYILEGNYCPGDNTEFGKECKEEVIKYYAKVIKKII